LQRSKDEGDDKVPASFVEQGEMLSLLKLSFYKPSEKACTRSSSQPKAIGNWSLLAVLCLQVSCEGPSSYLSLPPLPIAAHTVNLSHVRADRTELQPHTSCGVALFSWTNAEFKQIRSL